MRKWIFILIFVISLFFTVRTATAQTPTPSEGPIYIVQAGDTLSSIATRFNVSLTDIMSANHISDPNTLAIGQQLTIPGLGDITGVLNTEVINFGDSYRGLIRRTQLPGALIRKLNHLISPTEFYVGANMVVSRQENSPDLSNQVVLRTGESLLELAAEEGTDPWTLTFLNGLEGSWDSLPNDILYAPGQATGQTASGLPSAFVSAEIPTLPFKQGGTGEIVIKPAPGATLSGTLVNQPLHFFPMEDGRFVALQGIYVLLDPGVYPLDLNARLPDGSNQSFEQMVLVTEGDQPRVPIPVPPEDPTVMESEDKQIASIVSPATPNRYWQGKFSLPVGLPYCIKDWFGTPRSLPFNGSNYSYFHGGVDYGVCSQDHPFDIYAAAPGIVVFTDLLPVHGNTTIVDNGWGVYTIYAHQKQFGVAVGQQVQTGQVIGQIGQTGHVTGPHLHFEMWVNGVQVNPLDWLNRAYP